MTKKLYNLLLKLLAPLSTHGIEFLFLFLLLMVPEIYGLYGYSYIHKVSYIVEHALDNTAICIAIAYILILLLHFAYKCHKTIGIILNIGFHVTIYSITIVDVFVFKNFDTHISTYILQLINETNSREASDFINTYILTGSTICIFGVFICIAILEYTLQRGKLTKLCTACWISFRHKAYSFIPINKEIKIVIRGGGISLIVNRIGVRNYVNAY